MEDEACVFDEPDCGPIVMYDLSGEPWCERCKQRARAEMIAQGLTDPEATLH